MKHSLWKHTDDLEICLFTKDPSTPIKEALRAKPVEGVTKVMAYTKLRKNFGTFAQRRELCAQYDMFMTDERIMPMLPKKLGKAFFEKKKQPVPVRLTGGDFSRRLEMARDSTYLYLGWGACSAVRVGTTAFSADELADNILEAMPAIADAIPKKWKGIQSVHLKSANSVALPLYVALPAHDDADESGSGAAAAAAGGAGGSGQKKKAKASKAKAAEKAKARKRAASAASDDSLSDASDAEEEGDSDGDAPAARPTRASTRSKAAAVKAKGKAAAKPAAKRARKSRR